MDKNLRVFLLNAENLFLPPYSEEFLKRSGFPENYSKDIEKTKNIAKVISELDPQFILLSEVGGLDSLENFNERYLEKKYIPSLIEGNSDRGIEVGFLIKKEMPLRYEHYTHRNRPLNFNYPFELNLHKEADLPTHYLSRDIAELRVFNKEDKEDSAPLFIILHVHLKSQQDRNRIDAGGRLRRQAEFELLLKTYSILNKRYKGEVPIFLTGDLNGVAIKKNCDEAFKSIYKDTDLEDILELLDIPENERTTLVHFEGPNNPKFLQFDYFFIPSSLKNDLVPAESGVYRYKDKDGMPMPLPTASYMRYQMPSDHYPLLLTLRNFLP